MKTNAPTALSRQQAQQRFAELPEKFRDSAVGMVYEKIISLLDEAGGAPLSQVLSRLFPDIDHAKARTRLATQFVNRPHRDANDRAPLRLRISRAPRGKGVEEQVAVQRVDFVSETPTQPLAHIVTPQSPRYDPQRFASARARQASGEELLQAARDEAQQQTKAEQAQPGAAALDAGDETEAAVPNAALQRAYLDQTAGRNDKAWLNFGVRSMRHGSDESGFEPGPAQQSAGFSSAGEEVNCLQAMLQWAQPQSPLEKGATKAGEKRGKESACAREKPRLLALLGDYGAGKTSHAMQFCRVLNGEAPYPDFDGGDGGGGIGATLPKGVFIDLATLAGVGNLGQLTLAELLTLALNQQAGRPLFNSGGAGGAGADSGGSSDINEMLAAVRRGEVVLVYDGLDELLRNDAVVLHNVFNQLLKVLESRPQQPPAQARVVVSCRTHYFRTLEEQNAFFDTRRRGVAERNDYLCLSLLPWKEENIDAYLRKNIVDADEAAALLAIINDTYNLAELASRPILLALMSEQVGELLRRQGAGEQISAASLYGITVAEWIARDNGKHSIEPEHKPLLMGALATAMWSEGEEQWRADRLDAWVANTLPRLYPRYTPQQTAALQDDLRTATFIVRADAERFNFAHRSFMEYFLARFLIDAAEHCSNDPERNAAIHQLLLKKKLNKEATDFLHELWGQRLGRLGPKEGAAIAAQWWRWLQEDDWQEATSEGQNNEEKSPPPAPPAHAIVFSLACQLTAHKEAQPHIKTIAPRLDPQRPINLRGAEFIFEEWRDLDLGELPEIDLRGANLLQLHAFNCRFGRLRCDRETNWAQAVLRDCDSSRIEWNNARLNGALIRHGHKMPKHPLRGSWLPPCHHFSVFEHGAVLSPDGRSALMANRFHVTQWDLASGRERARFFPGHFDVITCLAIDPQGESVLGGDVSRYLILWRLRDGAVELEIDARREEHKRLRLKRVAFAEDGATLFAWYNNGEQRAWRRDSGEEVAPPSRSLFIEATNSENQITFDVDLARCLLQDRRSNRSLLALAQDSSANLAMDAKGETALSVNERGCCHLWNPLSGDVVKRISIKKQGWRPALSPMGDKLAALSLDGELDVWDTVSGRLCHYQFDSDRWDSSIFIPQDVVINPQGSTLAVTSDDGSLFLVDTEEGKTTAEFNVTEGAIYSIAFTPNGRSLICGCMDGSVKEIDCATGEELLCCTGHEGGVHCVAVSPNGELLLSGGWDATVRLWDAGDGRELFCFSKHQQAVTALAFSPDGRHILSGDWAGTTLLWRASDGALLRRFQGHAWRVNSVAFSGAGPHVITTSGDGTARVWFDAALPEELDSMAGANDGDGPPPWRGRCRITAPLGWRGALTTALFDANGDLLDYNEAAADSWLFTMANGQPEPVEMAPVVEAASSS